ncbi:DUF4136 domain-containing protein [Vibrio superstes]|uniref:DUF4136 domain-containing protein n=1 Tax=Vibrio superstes NBRC 103154 TaxID=1219062 RepID=A0A511QKV3_9VIBR|nr:DUF4136 domain-containing protein [Vibrio superstes]GEM77948.1 hypothetical protein VSU01S_01930 [Vibrio superstes NBRC 103154]
MKWLFAIAFALVLSACTTTTKPANNFAIGIVSSGDFQLIQPGAKTYAWHPKSGVAYVESGVSKKTLKHVFNEAISKSLEEKGYQRVSLKQQPNFIVGYGVAVESELNDDDLFDKTQLATGIPASDFGNAEQKGTIFIAMYNYPLMELKWRALAQGAAAPELEPEKSEERIKSYVDTMLKEMPVAQ